MAIKLTLRIEENLLQRIKAYSKVNKKSISRIVADYLSSLTREEKKQPTSHAPITQSLTGVLKNSKISQADYKRYLEEKYL